MFPIIAPLVFKVLAVVPCEWCQPIFDLFWWLRK